uniref:Uncharacterized protein n=1 Tax=Bombyx mori TaxID=7091 RepID=A0A8R1WMG2_BOMMO|nr:uncharacterized protein LOC101739782 isoform X1 [Bombyx mori]
MTQNEYGTTKQRFVLIQQGEPVVINTRSCAHVSLTMKLMLFAAVLCVILWLGASVPINMERRLVNRPPRDEVMGLSRPKRHQINAPIKGRQSPHRRGGIEHMLRKGEYVCGDKICRLKPGEEPAGCNGICQFPIDPMHYDGQPQRRFGQTINAKERF